MIKFSSELGLLADSEAFRHPVEIDDTRSKSHLMQALTMMITIRSVEEEIANWVEEGLVKCPCHLGIGQEAIAVGVAAHLTKQDRVFGTHRSHSHFLALGGSVYELFAEVLGKRTGCSKGMGGSMHLLDQKSGFYGSVPIVGATIPIAVGAALAAKMDKKGSIAVCFFGDGAAEEGVLHESLNLASIYRLPVLFVCENNLYSSHLDIKLRQPSDRIARFADAHFVPNKIVDGNDVIAVEEATGELLHALRQGQDAGFLETVTYRWRGHVGPKEDIDVGVRRKPEDLASWKKRDPILRLFQGMVIRGFLQPNELVSLTDEIRQSVHLHKQRALEDAYPETSTLMDYVYAD